MKTSVSWEVRRTANVTYNNGETGKYVDEIVSLSSTEVSDIIDALAETQRDDLMDKFLALLGGMP